MLLRYSLGLTLLILCHLAGNRYLLKPLAKRYGWTPDLKKLVSHAWLYGPCVGVLWLWIRGIPKVPATTLSWGSAEYGIAFLATLGMLPLTFVGTVIETKLWGGKLQEMGEAEGMALDSWVDGLCILVLAPVFEELYTRKFLYDRLAGHNLMLFLLFSAFCFGFMHCITGKLAVVIACGVTGFVLGLVYAASGNILLPILFHAGMNLCLAAIPEILEQTGHHKWVPLYRILTLIAGLAGLILFFINLGRFLPPAVTAQTGDAWHGIVTNVGTWIFLVTMLGIYILLRLRERKR